MVSSTHEHHEYLRQARHREGLLFTAHCPPPPLCRRCTGVHAHRVAPCTCHQAATRRKKKFATPVKREDVERDWRPRGYSVDLFVDPPGALGLQRWRQITKEGKNTPWAWIEGASWAVGVVGRTAAAGAC